MVLKEQMGLLSLQRLDIRFLAIVLFTLLSANVHSQQSDTLFKSKIISVFDVANTIPSEKLYLHTDRSIYNTGDTIWFEAYLVNAKTLMPSVQSTIFLLIPMRLAPVLIDLQKCSHRMQF